MQSMDLGERVRRLADRIPDASRPAAVFLISLLSISLVQWFVVWDDARLIDGKFWVPAVEQTSNWRFPAPGEFVYGYPGTTFLLPAGGIMNAFGTTAEYGHRLTMAGIVTLVGAIAATLAYLLRPRTLWWFFVLWLYAFQAQFSEATPPSGLFTALLPLLALLTLFAAKERPSALLLGAISFVGGLLLATRIDSAIPVLGVIMLYLATRRLASLYIVPLVATIVFLILTPSLYIESPVAYLANTFEKIIYHGEVSEHGALNPFDMMFSAGKFGLFALALGLLLFVTRKLKAFPKGYFLAWTGMTLAVLTGLSLIHHHPSWMYSPFLAVFELFLPLLVLDAYDALPEKGTFKKMRPEGALLRLIAPVFLALYALASYAQVARLY